MRRQFSILTVVRLCVAAFAVAGVTQARAQVAAQPDSVLTPDVRTLSQTQWDGFDLARAVDTWITGDLHGAAAILEQIDITRESSFAEADRAAFLLAVIYSHLKDDDAFASVAERAADPAGSPYRRWISYAQAFGRNVDGTAQTALPGAELLTAAMLLNANRPQDALHILESTPSPDALTTIHLYLQAQARAASGGDAMPAWALLADRKAQNPLEADLVATALLQLAAIRIATGADAIPYLERVAKESRHAARAAHIRAMIAIEAGDTATARNMFESLLRDQPMYEGRREVHLALGSIMMERMSWSGALSGFESADDDWLYEHDLLGHFENDAVLDDVWLAWEHQELWRDEIRLAPEIILANMTEAARGALDLHDDTADAPNKKLYDGLWPANTNKRGATWDRTDALSRHYPTPDEWRSLRTVQNQLAEARTALTRQDHLITSRQIEIARRVDYLQRGHGHAVGSSEKLTRAIIRLESILASLDAAVAQLEAVRDSAMLDIAVRTRDMTDMLRQELLFMQAVRHFHVDGPNRDRAQAFPDGVPSPGSVLAMEESLAAEATAFLQLFAEYYPALIARSFDEIWEPRLTGDSRHLYNALRIQLARSYGITSQLDSALASYADDPLMRAAVAVRGQLAADVDALAQDEYDVRRNVARNVAERGRTLMLGERESIDYHLADASYELAVELATNPATADNRELVSPARDRAVGHLDALLERYPDSIARGESRYRMADMQLLLARDDFQAKMADFLGEDPSADDIENRSLAPFVNYAPAAALYRAILAEDPGFPHQDAVLFNLGMIMSDDGQPAAAEHLERLVREFPESANVQEAYLRLGNDRFDRKDYAGSAPYFEQAAAGSDPAFGAIALYKLGWARFEGDRFGQSTDAFRRLVDLYEQHNDVAKAMDLRDEAEEYLVHSLARSGGASAFRDYFDGLGGRPYETDILISLGHLLRGISMYDEAIACDELWLARYPAEARALAVTERLVSTYKRWNKPEEARAAKIASAKRFLPGSDWYAANDAPALRAAGDKFAQSAYLETAAHHHKLAREKDNPADWQHALANYEIYLRQWPLTPDAARINYFAGEAANRVRGYGSALAHFKAAARSDSTQLVIDATWQSVAVTDAWYRSSQPTDKANGLDSLAVKLVTAAEDFLLLFPNDERGADIVWRKGNIAYAHGWYDEAAASFAQMAGRYPTDKRSAIAIRMSGDAYYRRGEFAAAGGAYEQAMALAQSAGQDSVVASLAKAIPTCYYKHAEGIAAADSVKGEATAAPLFARVARDWPTFEHADLALYRSGLGFAANANYADATRSWERLLSQHPTSEYARDSAVQIARTHEKSGNVESAASAYERFSRLYPADPDAPEALLRAVDMLAEAKDDKGAEQMRSLFLERFPGDTETVMEIRANRAVKDLARVTAGGATIGTLLAGAGVGQAGVSSSELQAYLTLAAQNPELATPLILAQVDYLKADEKYPKYAAMRLTQPLPKSIEAKKKEMETLVDHYNQCTKHGISEYSRAAAHRIGQVLIDFGDALIASERPSGLNADDLLAYDEVIQEQAWGFFDRGEQVWTELLRQVAATPDDPGGRIAATQQALWPRLAMRFLYRPEVEYPLVRATPAQRIETN